MRIIARLIPDRFILVLIAAMALASVAPVGGEAASTASLVSSAAVFIVFLLHGIRLPRAEVVRGVADWRVQGGVLLFVFGAMALAGLGLARLLDGWLPPLVALGFLYCGVLPTTVQSATTYTSMAGGNVATSVVGSAIGNLAAIAATPILFALLAGREGAPTLSGDLGVRIALILLLPFLIGQMLQRWVRPWVLAHPALVKSIDQAAIAIAVYAAFSAAVIAGIWSQLSGADLALIGGGVAAMLAAGFGGAWWLGGRLTHDKGMRSAILFLGSHKSVAVGAPLAALLFPPQAAGMILLPILTYHLAQLILSAWIAPVLARR